MTQGHVSKREKFYLLKKNNLHNTRALGGRGRRCVRKMEGESQESGSSRQVE